MQFIMQVLHGDWNELLGSLLIIGGLALASWTLGKKHVATLAFAFGRVPARPHHGAGSWPARRIDAASQWRRVVDIAESEFVRLESAVVSHASALEAVEAADEAVTQLLADCAAAFTQPETEARFELQPRPAREPKARPLAA